MENIFSGNKTPQQGLDDAVAKGNEPEGVRGAPQQVGASAALPPTGVSNDQPRGGKRCCCRR
jgi:hypothetical protein